MTQTSPLSATQKRQAFRAILTGTKCLYPASVFDPISARLAEDIGFETMMMAGSIASQTVLGAPDLILLTLSEFADLALRINRATDLPMMADADHGYGNALNVMRTVEELEAAGIAGMTIEDTALPRPFGEAKARPLPLDESIGKMKAAVAARTDANTIIFARTGAIAMTGLEDTLIRIAAYEKTGVDAIFLSGVKTRAEVEAVTASTKLPVVLGTLTAEIEDRDFLSSKGIPIALLGHAPIMAAVEATRATLQALRDGVKPKALTGLASDELMKRLTRDDHYRAATKNFLTPQ
jgi:carboxyvinyl-carboxyphosphonate phosphorylmutase